MHGNFFFSQFAQDGRPPSHLSLRAGEEVSLSQDMRQRLARTAAKFASHRGATRDAGAVVVESAHRGVGLEDKVRNVLRRGEKKSTDRLRHVLRRVRVEEGLSSVERGRCSWWLLGYTEQKGARLYTNPDIPHAPCMPSDAPPRSSHSRQGAGHRHALREDQG